ncbi:MAG: Plug domain-containing protein, partial [Candidatus Riflemargulisbacteria bacterium]
MGRRGLVFCLLFLPVVAFSTTGNYTHFLNNRSTSLKDMVKAVVRDQQDVTQKSEEQSKLQSFSYSGGSGSAYSLSGEDYMEKNRLTVFPDVKMMHRELPGVSDGGDFDASLYFRGGGAYETVTIVNGQPVYEAFVFDGKGSLINPQLIKETKVYTSGIPVCYPDVLSGVIDVKEREGDRFNYRMDVAQSLTDVQLIL